MDAIPPLAACGPVRVVRLNGRTRLALHVRIGATATVDPSFTRTSEPA